MEDLARLALDRAGTRVAEGPREWFGWARPATVALWQQLEDAHRTGDPAAAPTPPGPESNAWPPSGLHGLGAALAWAAASEALPIDARGTWAFHLGAWLAGRGDAEAALNALDAAASDQRSHALAARLLLRARRDAVAAAARYRLITDAAMLQHPQVVFERDVALEHARALALAADGTAAAAAYLAERRASLDAVGALFSGGGAGGSREEHLLERHAALLEAEGFPRLALDVLEGANFQLVHQRYTRTALWRRCKVAVDSGAAPAGKDASPQPPIYTPSDNLGEDQLAAFGAYAEFEEDV